MRAPTPARTRRASGPIHALAARVGASLVVSVVTTLWSLSILVALTRGGVLGAGPASVVATLSGIPWSYWLNRRFVWRRRGDHRLRGEVLPFVAMCTLALVVSTAAVTVTDRWAARTALTGWWRTTAVVGADVGSFGALWVAQFVLLDRLLFAPRRAVPRAATANGPKDRGRVASPVPTVNSGVGTSPTEDVDPSGWAGDEESERGS